MDGQDDAPRRWRVVVVGPLAPFADGLRGALAGQGYAGDTVTDHVHLLADFSGWLGGQGLDAAGVTEERAGQFLRDRRDRGHRTGVSPRAIAPVLGYLRSLCAAPPRAEPVPATGLESLLARYRAYLSGERGVSASNVQALPAVRRKAPPVSAGRPGCGPRRALRSRGDRLRLGMGGVPEGQGR
jgi:integrase/recombinase XerD